MFGWVWIISIIATVYLAEQKRLGAIGYLFLSIFLGPIALIIAILMPSKGPVSTDRMPGVFSLEDAKRQLREIQHALVLLQAKAKRLEEWMEQHPSIKAETPVLEQKIQEPVPQTITQPVPFIVPKVETLLKKEDMEMAFGRNWLNKIGVAVLALGIAFLISYSFKYFGPFLKIAFGYVVGGILLYAGTRLERDDKLVRFGRGLMGGAWAIIYFTTYAMHHFEASRIIASQNMDLICLVIVVIAMMAHALRYKSEGMVAMVLFVAYLTTTIGPITGFTMVSLLILAAVVLYLVHRFQWVLTLSLGIVLTYGVHYVWVMPHLLDSPNDTTFLGIPFIYGQDAANLFFLTGYALIFLMGTHLLKKIEDPMLSKALAVTNYWNIAVYSFLAYHLVLRLFSPHHDLFVLAIGLVYLLCAAIMKRAGNRNMYVSDLVAAVFALSWAVALRYLPTTSLIIWIFEIPFLLYIGITFKEKIFRYLSYGLLGVVGFRLLLLTFSLTMADIQFMGLQWKWYAFMSFWLSISMAVSFLLTHYLHKEDKDNEADSVFDHIFSFCAGLTLTVWLSSLVRFPWEALAYGLEGLGLLIVGRILGLKRFRMYAYAVLALCVGTFLFDPIYATSFYLKWFIVCMNVLLMFMAYALIKNQEKGREHIPHVEAQMVFIAALLILTAAIFQHIPYHWISLSLGLASVVVILAGFFDGDKTERMGGMALLALTLGRVVFVELAGLDIIFKIITLIVLGILFLGVSYIYNRFTIKGKQ